MAIELCAARQQLADCVKLGCLKIDGSEHLHDGKGNGYVEVVARPRTAKGRAKLTIERLADLYPGTAKELCALDHANAFQLLAATILSAQTTDARVNMVTPVLFARYPDAAALAHADPEAVEEIVRTTGFFRAKTKSLIGMASVLEERFGGEVPPDLEDLVTVPGVGRKTGNVVRSVAFGLPGLPVDTHVLRLSKRLGLIDDLSPAAQKDAVKVEFALNALVPPDERGAFSLRVILHGRAICNARKPACPDCALNDYCPSSLV
jgi:endonuclease-3